MHSLRLIELLTSKKPDKCALNYRGMVESVSGRFL